MKQKIRYIAAILITIALPEAFAVFPAPLPKFQTKGEINSQRTRENHKQEVEHIESSAVFYTGKPFDQSREKF